MTMIGEFWVEFVQPLIIKNKKKKNRKISLYKEKKCGIHTTLNGVGCVGKLFRK